MTETFLQRRRKPSLSSLFLCDPDASEVETVSQWVLTSRRHLLLCVNVSRWFSRINDCNFELSSHPLVQRVIDAQTCLSVTEKHQLLGCSSKRGVNFLIISQLPFTSYRDTSSISVLLFQNLNLHQACGNNHAFGYLIMAKVVIKFSPKKSKKIVYVRKYFNIVRVYLDYPCFTLLREFIFYSHYVSVFKQIFTQFVGMRIKWIPR